MNGLNDSDITNEEVFCQDWIENIIDDAIEPFADPTCPIDSLLVLFKKLFWGIPTATQWLDDDLASSSPNNLHTSTLTQVAKQRLICRILRGLSTILQARPTALGSTEIRYQLDDALSKVLLSPSSSEVICVTINLLIMVHVCTTDHSSYHHVTRQEHLPDRTSCMLLQERILQLSLRTSDVSVLYTAVNALGSLYEHQCKLLLCIYDVFIHGLKDHNRSSSPFETLNTSIATTQSIRRDSTYLGWILAETYPEEQVMGFIETKHSSSEHLDVHAKGDADCLNQMYAQYWKTREINSKIGSILPRPLQSRSVTLCYDIVSRLCAALHGDADFPSTSVSSYSCKRYIQATGYNKPDTLDSNINERRGRDFIKSVDWISSISESTSPYIHTMLGPFAPSLRMAIISILGDLTNIHEMNILQILNKSSIDNLVNEAMKGGNSVQVLYNKAGVTDVGHSGTTPAQRIALFLREEGRLNKQRHQVSLPPAKRNYVEIVGNSQGTNTNTNKRQDYVFGSPAVGDNDLLTSDVNNMDQQLESAYSDQSSSEPNKMNISSRYNMTADRTNNDIEQKDDTTIMEPFVIPVGHLSSKPDWACLPQYQIRQQMSSDLGFNKRRRLNNSVVSANIKNTLTQITTITESMCDSYLVPPVQNHGQLSIPTQWSGPMIIGLEDESAIIRCTTLAAIVCLQQRQLLMPEHLRAVTYDHWLDLYRQLFVDAFGDDDDGIRTQSYHSFSLTSRVSSELLSIAPHMCTWSLPTTYPITPTTVSQLLIALEDENRNIRYSVLSLLSRSHFESITCVLSIVDVLVNRLNQSFIQHHISIPTNLRRLMRVLLPCSPSLHSDMTGCYVAYGSCQLNNDIIIYMDTLAAIGQHNAKTVLSLLVSSNPSNLTQFLRKTLTELESQLSGQTNEIVRSYISGSIGITTLQGINMNIFNPVFLGLTTLIWNALYSSREHCYIHIPTLRPLFIIVAIYRLAYEQWLPVLALSSQAVPITLMNIEIWANLELNQVLTSEKPCIHSNIGSLSSTLRSAMSMIVKGNHLYSSYKIQTFIRSQHIIALKQMCSSSKSFDSMYYLATLFLSFLSYLEESYCSAAPVQFRKSQKQFAAQWIKLCHVITTHLPIGLFGHYSALFNTLQVLSANIVTSRFTKQPLRYYDWGSYPSFYLFSRRRIVGLVSSSKGILGFRRFLKLSSAVKALTAIGQHASAPLSTYELPLLSIEPKSSLCLPLRLSLSRHSHAILSSQWVHITNLHLELQLQLSAAWFIPETSDNTFSREQGISSSIHIKRIHTNSSNEIDSSYLHHKGASTILKFPLCLEQFYLNTKNDDLESNVDVCISNTILRNMVNDCDMVAQSYYLFTKLKSGVTMPLSMHRVAIVITGALISQIESYPSNDIILTKDGQYIPVGIIDTNDLVVE